MKKTLITAVAIVLLAAVANEAQARYPKTVREKYSVSVHRGTTVGVTTPTLPIFGTSPVVAFPTPVTPGYVAPGFVAPGYPVPAVMPTTSFGSHSTGFSASYSRETTYTIPSPSTTPTRFRTPLPGRSLRR